MKAQDYLRKGAELLEQRGKDYDKPEGERSMGKCVRAFNAITGRDLTESEGWLLLQVLKDVRQWQNPGRFHADSAEDCISYAALKAEALAFDAEEPAAAIDDDSERMQAIGQNGNTGEHYGNAPSWAEAPEWANCLAQDFNGKWNWYDEDPSCDSDHEGVEWMLDCSHATRFEFARGGQENPNWRQTLQRRPQKD